MQNVNNIVEEAKRKRSLSDLKPNSLPEGFNTINTVLPENNNSVNEVQDQNTRKTETHNSSNNTKKEEKNSVKEVIPENQNTRKKVKVTVYITEESWQDFNNVYGTRILNQRKTDKGDLMQEAIELLKEREFNRKPE